MADIAPNRQNFYAERRLTDQAIINRSRELDKAMGESQERFSPNRSVDPISLMSALFDTEYWKQDVWPRIVDYAGAVSDKEFWTEDVARNVKPALKKTGKAYVSGIAGAPVDLTVIAAHTFWWVTDNLGLSNGGDYSWLEGMPDFKKIPVSSDWIMKNVFEEEPEGLEWIAGSLLQPPANFTAKAAIFIGAKTGFPKYVASLGNDTQQVRNAHKNYNDAQYAAELVKRGEMTHSEMIAETGWSLTPNDELQMFVDSSEASFNWFAIDDALIEGANTATENHTIVSMRTGDIWDHPELRKIYGEEYGDFNTTFSLEKIPDGKDIMGNGGYRVQDKDGNWWQVSTNGAEPGTGGAVMRSQPQWEKSTAEVRGWPSRDYPGQRPMSQQAMRDKLEQVMIHEYRHGFSANNQWVGGGSSRYYEQLIQQSVNGYLSSAIPLLVEQYAREGVDVVGSTQFFDILKGQFRNVDEDLLRSYIRNGATMARGEVDGAMSVSHRARRDRYEADVQNIINMVAGSERGKEAVDIFARKIDNQVIYDMSRNIYGRLGDEQAARMQEYLWMMREKNPEKRMEMARAYANEVAWTYEDLPPYIERLFGPDYDPTAPVRGLNQVQDADGRFRVATEGNKWESYMKGEPERAPWDEADKMNVEVEDGITVLGDFKEAPRSDPLQPEGPVFDRGRDTQRTLSTRGGTEGGLMDSSFEERVNPGGLPEGTQQVGTPEELFPAQPKPTVEVPGQDHYSNYEGILTEEMAIDELLNKRPGNGAVREAANKLLHGEPMKYKSDEWLMNKASELGIEAKKLSDKELKLKIKRENYLKKKQTPNPQSEEPPKKDYLAEARAALKKEDPDLPDDEIEPMAIADAAVNRARDKALATPKGEIELEWINWGGDNAKMKALKNPDEAMLRRWAGRDIEEVRWVRTPDGDLVVWDAEKGMHEPVMEALGYSAWDMLDDGADRGAGYKLDKAIEKLFGKKARRQPANRPEYQVPTTRKRISTLKDEYIHGNYGIRARGSSMQQTYSPRSDDIYFNQRKRMWRGSDSELTDEEINELAFQDLQRFQKNKETVGSWDHGLHKVDLPTSAGGAGGPVKIDILKNPTKQEFDKWARDKFRNFYRRPDVREDDVPGVRVITDVNGNVYVWDADDALHHDVVKGTGMQYDYEDDWTDVDSIDVDDLFNQLVKGKIYEKAYE